jgi:hypothetical protein
MVNTTFSPKDDLCARANDSELAHPLHLSRMVKKKFLTDGNIWRFLRLHTPYLNVTQSNMHAAVQQALIQLKPLFYLTISYFAPKISQCVIVMSAVTQRGVCSLQGNIISLHSNTDRSHSK